MDQIHNDLKIAHGDFAGALDAFAKLVLSSATGREVTELKSVSVKKWTDTGMVTKYVIRQGGSCGVYDDSTGTCRLCTPEEDQGEIIPG